MRILLRVMKMKNIPNCIRTSILRKKPIVSKKKKIGLDK